MRSVYVLYINMRTSILSVVLCYYVSLTTSVIPEEHFDEDSFSFHRFSGPVSGEVREVIVPDTNPYNSRDVNVDYVAKPDYAYIYGVQDKEHGNSQTHQQTRDGDKVHGEYKVLQADGLIRIVRYTADPTTGFKATVEYLPS